MRGMSNLDPIRENARKASTESLMDQATVFREEMESPAMEIIDLELQARGITALQLAAHTAMRERDGIAHHPDNTVIRCTYCTRPAIKHVKKWHRLWGWFLPLFPRQMHLCKNHEKALPMDVHGRPLHFDPDAGE